MKQCVRCLQWKDESEFDWRCKALGIRYVTCRACQKGYSNKWCQKCGDQEMVSGSVKEYVHSYLLTHPCTACGESDPRVLEFHYIGGKGWIISGIIGGGNDLAAIQAEIANCVVLCTNCYRKISNGELGRFRSRK
jgi:hypothetical protein